MHKDRSRIVEGVSLRASIVLGRKGDKSRLCIQSEVLANAAGHNMVGRWSTCVAATQEPLSVGKDWRCLTGDSLINDGGVRTRSKSRKRIDRMLAQPKWRSKS